MSRMFHHLILTVAILGVFAVRQVLPNITGSLVVPDVKCVVHKWSQSNSTMICNWSVIETTVPITYRMVYSLCVLRHRAVCRNTIDTMTDCPHPTASSCTWKSLDDDGDKSLMYDDDTVYYIWLIVNNSVNSNNTSFHIKPVDIVKLSATAIELFNVTSNSALLRLERRGEKNLTLYWVTFEPVECTHSTQSFNTTTLDILLPNLKVYNKYSITVKCMPIRNGIPRGLWSDPAMIMLHTAQDVPSQLAEITAGGFKLEKSNEREIGVTVFWQPMPTCTAGGVVTNYIVFYRVRQAMPLPLSDWLNKSASSESSNIRLRLSSTQDYEVIVHASTALGLNNSLLPVPLVISQHTSDIIAEKLSLKVQSNASQVIIEWESITNATGYTVYWCQATNVERFVCQNAAEWIHLPSHQHFFQRHFDHLHQMNFAVSVEFFSQSLGAATSSGMIWSPCIYRLNADIAQPLNLKLLNNHDTSIHVQWSKPGCTTTGYISHYIVEYCRQHGDQCIDIIQLSVKQPLTEVRLLDLMTSSTYQVRVMSCSPSSNSTFTDRLTETTDDDVARISWSVILIIIFLIILFTVITIAICIFLKCKETIDVKVPPRSDVLLSSQSRSGDDYI